MLRCARVWLLLALPCWAFAATDLVEDWTPYAWALFYTFAGFGIVSLLLCLFEDSEVEIAQVVTEPLNAKASELIEAPQLLPVISPVPTPFVVVTLGVSGIAAASSSTFEAVRGPTGPISLEATSPTTSV